MDKLVDMATQISHEAELDRLSKARESRQLVTLRHRQDESTGYLGYLEFVELKIRGTAVTQDGIHVTQDSRVLFLSFVLKS